MSPEAMLEGTMDPCADVWPPGAILQECFTGVLPYGDGACSDDEAIKAAIDREATIPIRRQDYSRAS